MKGGSLMATRGFQTKEKVRERIDLFAYAMVNVCMMDKTASYKYVYENTGDEPPIWLSSAVAKFYERNKEAIEERIDYYREENRKVRNDMRDNNIAVLVDIIKSTKNNGEKIRAIQTLNTMFGYDNKTVNVKTDDTIKVELTE